MNTEKTEAPSPLPEVLPAGTSRASFAQDLGGWILVKRRPGWSGDGYFPPQDADKCTGGIIASAVSWASYYKSLASTKPESKWEPKVGDRVEWDESKNPCSVLIGGEGMLSGTIIESEGIPKVRRDVPSKYGTVVWCVPLKILRPANAPGSPVPRSMCPGCNRPEFNGLRQACDGCGVTTHQIMAAKSSPKPVEPARPKRDPYVCHRETMASILSGSPYELSGQLERSIALQTEKKAAVKARHLADFDRPRERFGKMGNLCRFGAKLGGGWDSEDT